MSRCCASLTLMVALAACAGSGDRGEKGDSAAVPPSDSTRAAGAAAGSERDSARSDTARRRLPKGAVTDTGLRQRNESLRVKPPEVRQPPPRLDRPLGVPPDSTRPKRDTTGGSE